MLMYQAYQTQVDVLWPLRTAAKLAVPMLQDPSLGLAARTPRRELAAACQVMALAEVTHRRPAWGIAQVTAGGRPLSCWNLCHMREYRRGASACAEPPI